MHDVSQLIAQWRARLAAAGLRGPALLDELEAHLRDAIEEEMARGLDAAQAFAAAQQHLGGAHALHLEFAKLTSERGDNMQKKTALIWLSSAIVILLALSMILPALGRMHGH